MTREQSLSRLAELKAMFLEILSEETDSIEGPYDPELVYEIETHLSIEEWLNELCAKEPDWAADWQDIYEQLVGENVEPWRELKRLVETISNL